MPTPLGGLYKSALGAYLRSALGARGLPLDEDLAIALESDILTRLTGGGIAGGWLSILWDSIGTNRRVGHSSVACYPGMAKLLARFLTNKTHTPGIRIAGIKEDGDGAFVRTTSDTYLSRQWDIVPTTSFPAWPPDSVPLIQYTPSGDNIEIYQELSWSGSWTYSAGNPRPRGYLLYVEPDDDDPDGVPWYPIFTCQQSAVGTWPPSPPETDTATLIYVQYAINFVANI